MYGRVKKSTPIHAVKSSKSEDTNPGFNVPEQVHNAIASMA
jgi:hypothetical protein